MKKLLTVILTQLRCLRCGYTWWPRPDDDGTVPRPKRCPGPDCKNPYWDTPRTRPVPKPLKRRRKIRA